MRAVIKGALFVLGILGVTSGAWACPVGSVCEQFPAYTNAAPSVTVPAPTDRIPYVQGATTKFMSQLYNPFVGPFAGDGANLSLQTGPNTAASIYQATAPLETNWDSYRATITVPTGSTAVNTDAVAGYVWDNAAASGFAGTGVALYGNAYAAVNGAHAFGLNVAMADKSGITGGILQNELDINVTNVGTSAYGLVFAGASTAQPTSGAAVVINGLNVITPGTSLWPDGIIFEPDCCTIAELISPIAFSGANLSSMPIYWQTRDSSANIQNLIMIADPANALDLLQNLPGASFGFQVFNNASTTTNTSAIVGVNTHSGQGLFFEKQTGASTASLNIFNSGTGGMILDPGAGGLVLENTPTSCAGVPSGTIWNNVNVLNVCP
jgi:hypothetical protein